MGCCESCFGNSNKQYESDGPTETDRLISHDGQSPPPSFTETRVPSEAAVPHPRGNEQSALSRILNSTATNVIDVSAVESRGLEQNEYHDKARQYSNRVNMVLASSGRSKHYKPTLPNGVPAPQIILASQPISQSDIELITSAAMKAAQAIQGVKVQHKEDLVVPFGVP